MTTLSEFRQRARATLGGNIFTPEWIYAMLVSLIGSAILGVSSFGIVLILILTGPVNIGISYYYLGLTRRTITYDRLSVALDGIHGDVSGNIISGLLVYLYTFLWLLLFIIPGIVKSYAYRMTYYVKCDHPEFTATQAIDESRRIMNGNKMRLFLLDLSFIGWFIIGILCCGIGTIWVNAYLKASEAEFYEEIKYSRVIDTPFSV